MIAFGSMKKALKVLGLALLAVVLLAGGAAAYIAATGIPSYAPGQVTLEVEVTPERVALGCFDVAGIVANNTALALNAGTFGSVANAAAGQVITVTQS